MEIGEPKKPVKMPLQHGWMNERNGKKDMVVVAVIAGNEEGRKEEQRVATQFHPVVCVVHDPFTVIASNILFSVIPSAQ